MARILDAFSQFFDGNGQPLSAGYLKFFQNKTTIAEPTFNDPGESIANPTKVPLDGEGRMALNAYASVLCTVKLFNSVDSQVESFDDVTPRGGLTSGFAFAGWLDSVTYQPNISIVTGSDGNYYKAKQTTKDVDPVTDFAAGGDNWERVYFNEFWSSFKTYVVGDRVTFLTNLKNYICVTSNLNEDPSTDTGANWELDEPALDWIIGRTYKVGEKAYSKIDNILYIAISEQSGNEPSVDDGTKWLPAHGVVDKPVNALPANGATGISRNPTLTTDAYSITGGSGLQEWSEFQLSDDGFSTVFYSSDITRDLTSHNVPLKLPAATLFSYRMSMKGVRTDVSDFSDVTTFTTLLPLSESFANDLTVGNGSSRTLVSEVDLNANTGFVFIANKSVTTGMRFCSTIRGSGISSQVGTSADEISEVTGVTSFNSNGYSVGSSLAYNGNNNNIFSLTFKSTPKIVDIVQYNGNGTNRVVSHGLGSVPSMYIICRVTGAGGSNWRTRHNASVSSSEYLVFGVDDQEFASGGIFNTSAATSTEFSLGASTHTNASGSTYIAILFGDDVSAGVSYTEYTGTASSGNKITTTFEPAVIITKSKTTGDWIIYSKKMGTSTHIVLDATAVSGSGGMQTFDSDGYEFTASSPSNISGIDYIAIAFANEDVF